MLLVSHSIKEPWTYLISSTQNCQRMDIFNKKVPSRDSVDDRTPRLAKGGSNRFFGWSVRSMNKSLIDLHGWESEVLDGLVHGDVKRGFGKDQNESLNIYKLCFIIRTEDATVKNLKSKFALRIFWFMFLLKWSFSFWYYTNNHIHSCVIIIGIEKSTQDFLNPQKNINKIHLFLYFLLLHYNKATVSLLHCFFI